ncbi:MAG TPA: hypothetical protein VFW45_03275 [Candidatus Polarisedimenticolia bacterium]|nr:hypothetical protein [Candidatus Polarisedimenticolia bacterium]
MRIPGVGVIDERFLEHRRRSTSLAGIVSSALSIVLFEWRYLVDHIFSWDLLAIGLTFVVVKLTVLIWYRLTD